MFYIFICFYKLLSYDNYSCNRGGIYFFPDVSTFVLLNLVRLQDFMTDRVVQTFGCNLLMQLQEDDSATTKNPVCSGLENNF